MSDRDIAIIGMAGLFPKAPDVATFWNNILAKVDAIGDPVDWPDEFTSDPTSSRNDQVYTRRGGYVGDLLRFDAKAYGVMPRAVDGAEPEHFVALGLAHEALADAGYESREFPRERTGIIIGRGTYVNRGMVAALQHGVVVDQTIRLLGQLHPEHGHQELEALRAALKAQLPPFNAETAPGLAHSALCGRIANRLDLMGPAYTIDAACASSLLAVDQASKELLDGTCDLALAGGIQISTSFPIAALFCQLGALSRSGTLRSFHPDADGTLLGEGAGIVVLKRRADAERDGDRIYALIKGIGVASDGRALGVLAPRVEGEELAMRRAYARAGVSPDTIGLVEAHGTGTPAGDAVEVEALRRIFGARTGLGRCALGSVKTMIGHSIPAAGVAGLIKATLALHYKVLPPTLHAEGGRRPQLADGPLYLNAETRPWVHGGRDPRRAGVSAFGFGGINAHVVLEEAPPRRGVAVAANGGARDSELLVVWGASRDEVGSRCRGLLRCLETNHDLNLADVAAALAAEFDVTAPVRLAIVAVTSDDLRSKLAHAAQRLGDPACARIKDRSGIFYFADPLAGQGTLAFLFPGEGAQYPGMLQDLSLHFPVVRRAFDRMDRGALERGAKTFPHELVFPSADVADAEARMFEMDSAVEVVFAADQAMYALLRSLEIMPHAVLGHSSGEYSALLAAGAVRVDAEDGLFENMRAMARVGARAVERGLVVEAAMLAVAPTNREQIPALLARAGDTLYLAIDNCPHQAVLCGGVDAITAAHAELRSAGVLCQRLPIARGYHTPLFAPIRDELRPFFESLRFVSPSIALYSCVSAAQVPDDPAAIRELAIEQWAARVRFRETIETMHAAGVRLFVEVGPRGNLTAFVDDVLGKRPHLAAAANVEKRSGLLQLHHLLGLLAAHGVSMRLGALHASRRSRPLPIDALWQGSAVPPEPVRSMRLPTALPILRVTDAERAAVAASAGRATSAAAGAGAPMPAAVATTAPPPAAGIPAARGDATIRQYLGTMEEFLETQEAVMQAFLRGQGRGPAAPQLAAAPAVASAPRSAVTTAPPPRWTLAGTVVRRDRDAIVLRRSLALSEERFLLDHCLGGQVASDSSLHALPVCPMAMMLELMAAAAATAVPDRRPIGFRDVRASRWVAFSEDRIELETTVRPSGDDAAVEVRKLGPAGAPEADPPIIEGVVRLGARLLESPPPELAPLAEESSRPPDEVALYGERTPHGMFHGAAFRAVETLERLGDRGADATLAALPARGLFQSDPDPALAVDPILVDAAGQVLGYWNADALSAAVLIFPVGVRELTTYGDTLAPPARVRCRMRVRRVDGDGIVADFDLLGDDGRLHMRIRGWEVRRFRVPERYYEFRLQPREVVLSEVVESLAAPDQVLVRFEPPPGLFEVDGEIWREVLAHLVLSARERETWRSLVGADKRKREWLMGRIAVKDAVRRLLSRHLGLAVYPAEIEVTAGERGMPRVEGAWVAALGAIPHVSLAHSGNAAVAIAALRDGCAGVGVDLEHLGAVSREFEGLAFASGEREILAALPLSSQREWALRLWCAKEAAVKAVGHGFENGPRDAAVRRADVASGMVEVGLLGVPAHSTARVMARTACVGDEVLAVAALSVNGVPPGA